jgi:hypothetical protein
MNPDITRRLDAAVDKVTELVAQLAAADRLIEDLVAENEQLRDKLHPLSVSQRAAS